MQAHDIIVVGASAGGVEALRDLVRGLSPDLPAAVFVVVHVAHTGTSVLPSLLRRWGPLPAEHARDEQPITPGRVYVAPPDYHLIVKRDYVRIARGPRENGHRPAIDTLFRTAARAYGPRVVGVVLSGLLDDGTAGLAAIKNGGGLSVIQDPNDAMFSSMPSSALQNVKVDHIATAAGLGELLSRLAQEPVVMSADRPTPEEEQIEADMAELEPRAMHEHDRPGIPSAYACPECGGALFELREGQLVRYRCRVGHAYSPDTLLAEKGDDLEEALWTALRALEETAALATQMAERARKRATSPLVGRFEDRARLARQQAELIRRVLASNGVGAGQASPDESAGAPEGRRQNPVPASEGPCP